MRRHVPLIECTALGLKEDVDSLLAQSVDVNEQNDAGDTAALTAARNNRLDLLKILAKAGCDLSIEDETHTTCLQWARLYKNEEMIAFIEENLAAKPSISKA